MAPSNSKPLAAAGLRRIYDLIGRRDGVAVSTLRESDIDIDPDDIDDFIQELVDAGYLDHRDETLHIGIPAETDLNAVIGDDEYTIRIARQADLPAIKTVIEAVTGEKTYIEAETVAEELDQDERLIRFDEEKSRIFFVAAVEGDIVGWLHIEAPERSKLKHTAEFTLGIAPGSRGMGIGKRLMTTGLAWAEAHGYHKVYNTFPATNRAALAFLDSLPYDAHCEAVLRDHYRIDDEFVDQMALAVYLNKSTGALTHFDRVQREAEELYTA